MSKKDSKPTRPKPTKPTAKPAAKSAAKPAPPAKAAAKKGPVDREHDNARPISENRRARFEYEVIDTLECGIALVGSEVKSLRVGRMTIEEAYGRLRDDEVWLVGCDIPEYVQANRMNHEPRRVRKLLMHRREVRKFASRALEQGLTLIPLKMYFKKGLVKVLMGLCKGRKLHDKREAMKKRDTQRDIQRAMRRGQ